MEGAGNTEGADSGIPPRSVVFKKRVNPKKVKSETYKGQSSTEEDGTEEEVDKTLLSYKKIEQKLRQRHVGLDTETGNKMAKMSSAATSDNRKLGLQSIIGDHFSSRVESASESLSSENPHEKIMETYVEQKLGLKRKAEEALEESSSPNYDELLYRVPKDLKPLIEVKSDAQPTGSELDVGLYSGIAEVALPQSFKVKAQQDLKKKVIELNGAGQLDRLGSFGSRNGKSNDTLLMQSFMRTNQR